ncbi:EboA domain-containing protein [Streptomyces sp. NPDC047130]|uniref:EboA domain-containing protein n=1 Tax=Streptomyces sp. NPDC047130 TaxID=3155261 RepID=UPI0033DC29FB
MTDPAAPRTAAGDPALRTAAGDPALRAAADDPAARTPAPPAPPALSALSALRARLTASLPPDARDWLEKALAETEDSARELRFAEAGRRTGPDHADDARVLLLHAAAAGPDTLARLYHRGTAAERRAVLLALPHLVPGDESLALVEDALRTNDTRLVAAAVGPYGARHLPGHDWRHAVLKCLFTGVPLDAVDRLGERAHGDAELARMLGDFAAEREAAGRAVPPDLYRVLALADPRTEET